MYCDCRNQPFFAPGENMISGGHSPSSQREFYKVSNCRLIFKFKIIVKCAIMNYVIIFIKYWFSKAWKRIKRRRKRFHFIQVSILESIVNIFSVEGILFYFYFYLRPNSVVDRFHFPRFYGSCNITFSVFKVTVIDMN